MLTWAGWKEEVIFIDLARYTRGSESTISAICCPIFWQIRVTETAKCNETPDCHLAREMQTEWDKVRPIERITLLTLHMVWMPMSRAVKLGPQDIVVGIDIFLLRCMLMAMKVTKFLQKCPPLWFECSHQWEVTNESSVILMAVQKGMEGVDAQVERTARRKSGADDCTGD